MLIQRMRDGSEGVMAKIIIGLIVIVFALFGFGSITTFLAPVAKVATVNGEDITQQAMELAVERNRRVMMAQGASTIDEDVLRENVLDSLVTRELLRQASEDFDLYYGDAAIDAELVQTEVFQLDGVFNRDQFQRIIASAGYTPLGYREEMRTDKKFEQMLTGITRSAFLTGEEATRFNSLVSQSRNLAYLQLEVASLIDEVTVSDEEISDYYNENTDDFVTEETVSLQYVELKREDLAASLDVVEEDLQLYFETHQGDYSTDEQRHLAHILIEVNDDVSEEEAAARADEILDRIKDGEDFSALAMELSDDFGSRDLGGDLGVNEPGTFYPEFEAVAYDLNLNQISDPVKTEIGYHIIKVLDIEPAFTPTLDDVRDQVEQAYRLSETGDEFVTLSSRLAELLFESAGLDVPAAEIGLEIQTTGQLARDASHPLMLNAEVQAAAFSPDVLFDGNNSDLIELNEDYHVGLRVEAHNPSASKPLEVVKEDIRYILQQQKAQELAETKAEEIVAAIQQGSLAQFVADERGLTWQVVPRAVRSHPEVDPFILREAFKLPRPAEAKESLGWATLPNGDTVVMRVSDVINSPAEELGDDERQLIQQQLAAQMGDKDFREFESSLSQSASMERLN